MTVDHYDALLKDSDSDHEPLKAPDTPRMGKVALASLLLTCFIASANESFVLTTGTDVAAALDATEFSSWLITAYNLGYTTALPLYGKLCDLTGPRNALLLGLTLYGAGCIVTGLADTIYFALVGRIISGIGGSGMVEIVSVLISEMGSFHRVAMFRSYVTISSTLGVTCGAPMGALLANLFGWRWSFLVHVPVALVCMAVVYLALSSGEPQRHVASECTYGTTDGSKEEEYTDKPTLKSFNIPGLVLAMTAIVCFLGFIEVVPKQALENKPIFLLGFGGTFLISSVLFLANETYMASDPLIPLSLLRSPNLGLIYTTQFFIGISIFGMVPMFSDYWVSTLGLAAEEGAMCWAPATFGFSLGSLLTGKLTQRSPHYLRCSNIGIAIACSCFLLIIVRWTLHVPMMWEIMYLGFAWFGVGMILSSQFIALSVAKPEQNAATSVTTYYLVQQVGFMTGITISRPLMRRNMKSQLEVALGDTVRARELIKKILSDRRPLHLVPPALQERVLIIIQRSYSFPPVVGISALLVALYIISRQVEMKPT